MTTKIIYIYATLELCMKESNKHGEQKIDTA